jgi:hypothetical protein
LLLALAASPAVSTKLSRPNLLPDAVCSRNPSKSMLAHDAVAAAVSHEHHSIICVGVGLIQFVYGLHSRWTTGVTVSKKFILHFLRESLLQEVYSNTQWVNDKSLT